MTDYSHIDLTRYHKTQCPRCLENGGDKSRNNLQVYGLDEYGEHRGAFCFACDFTIPSSSRQPQEEEIVGREWNEEVHAKLKSITGTDPRGYRGIRKDISQWVGVRYEYSEIDGKVVRTYYPTTMLGSLMPCSGQKVRSHPKDFKTPGPLGETGKDCELFGQFRFKTFKHTLLIVGGEHDQLAAYQMLSDAQKNKAFDPVAVVSGTVGESGLHKQLAHNYEFVSQFKKIVLCLDNDEAGRNAAKDCLAVLPEGKTYVMLMRRKDPNSYIWDNERGVPVDAAQEFVNDFWNAKLNTPNGVKSAADAFSGIEDMLFAPRISLPPYMHQMQAMMGGNDETGYGMVQGKITNIIGDTSVGKSTHVNRMVYHWIFNSPVVPTIVTLEASCEEYMLEMMSMHMQTNLSWNFSPSALLDFIKTDEGIRMQNELCFRDDGSPRFFLIDERKGSPKALEEQMEVMLRKHGSKMFIVDVLTDLLRGSNENYAEDHLMFQKRFLAEGASIVNVLHTRKPPSSPDGKVRKVTEYDALGTSSFVQSAAYNIVMNRDKMDEDAVAQNTTSVDLVKCRKGKTGPAGQWYYDFKTAQCHDLNDWMCGKVKDF